MDYSIRRVEPQDKFYHLIGSEITFACELITIGGQISHEKGSKAIIRDLIVFPGHSYRPIPDIWIEEKISAIRIEGVNGCEYLPQTFEEFKHLKAD